MSDQKIESIVDNYYSILQFFKENPDVLLKWQNKTAGAYEAPAEADADINNPGKKNVYKTR